MRLKNYEFRDFIHKSKLKLENSLWKVESVLHPYSIKKFRGDTLKATKVLISLTGNGGIIWAKERNDKFKGIILNHPRFSGFKLVMQRQDKVYRLEIYRKDNKLIEEHSINVKKDEHLQYLIELIQQRIVVEQN